MGEPAFLVLHRVLPWIGGVLGGAGEEIKPRRNGYRTEDKRFHFFPNLKMRISAVVSDIGSPFIHPVIWLSALPQAEATNRHLPRRL
jgi:hypothetical protein